jgi:hypothetical protein
MSKFDNLECIKRSRLKQMYPDASPPKKYRLIEVKYNKISIKNDNMLKNCLESLRYYMVEELPHEIYDYILKNNNKTDDHEALVDRVDWDVYKDFFHGELMFLLELKNEEFDKLDKIKKTKLVEKAAEHGHLRLIKYFHKKKFKWAMKALVNASKNGYFDCLKYLHTNCKPTIKEKYIKYQQHNNNALFTYDSPSWKNKIDYITTITGYYGKLDCLKYLCDNNFKYDQKTTAYTALNGNVECLKYLHSIGCKWDLYTTINSAFGGHIDCLKFAYENGCILDQNTCSNAALKGNLKCLEYAYEKCGKFTDMTCANAAKGGNLECLKFALERGASDYEAAYEAACSGSLECLKYLYDNRDEDVTWTDPRLNRCAASKNVECLKLTHQAGCEWEDSIYAWSTNSVECLRYIYENESNWNPTPWSGSSWTCKRLGLSTCDGNHVADEIPFNNGTGVAAKQRNIKSLKFLHENGYCWSSATCEQAAYLGNVECLKYLHENGCPWDENTTIMASTGNLKCLKYAIENGCPYDIDDCLKEAIELNSSKVIDYLNSIK